MQIQHTHTAAAVRSKKFDVSAKKSPRAHRIIPSH